MRAAPERNIEEPTEVLRNLEQAEMYVAAECFREGPPRHVGVELEWTLHNADDPARRLDPVHLRRALGPHAPVTLAPDSPHHPLPAGCVVTVEPGGQVEISSPPVDSLGELNSRVSVDMAVVRDMLSVHGLRLGSEGLDRYRRPRRILDTPRYRAMESAFARLGSCGEQMMCSSAGLQICVDAGEGQQLIRRWDALHVLGPVLCALFANSPTPDGWCSGRQLVTLGTDPCRSSPAECGTDPIGAWTRRALNAAVICVRDEGDRWEPEQPVRFCDWIDGALSRRPTLDDLRYHLSTMFTPVRPQGYFEVRYLDAQPGEEWLAPVALLVALMSSDDSVAAVLDIACGVRGQWMHAAHYGLADPALARAARDVVAHGLPLIATSDLTSVLTARVIAQIERRLWNGGDGRTRSLEFPWGRPPTCARHEIGVRSPGGATEPKAYLN